LEGVNHPRWCRILSINSITISQKFITNFVYSLRKKKKTIGSEKRESAISSNIPYSSFKDSRLGKRGKTSVSGITLGFFAEVSQVVKSVPFMKYFKRI